MTVSYLKTKRELIDSGFDWLEAFDETIDEFSYNLLKTEFGEESPHDYFLVEGNLAELSKSLDKVLSYRRASNNLEEKAVRQALEYKLFKQNYDTVQKLETRDWNTKLAEVEVSSATEMVEQFNDIDHPLAKGFAVSANANRTANETFLKSELARNELVKSKWENVDLYSHSLQSRHDQSGHALNYRQRSQRLKELLKQELISAFRFAKAASFGLRVAYGYSKKESELPALKLNGYIDELVYWAGEKVRQINLIKEKEVVFEHVIFTRTTKKSDGKFIYDSATFNAQRAKGVFEFDLTDYFPQELLNGGLRVVGVDVGLRLSDIVKTPQHKYFFTSALVFPPDQPDLNSSSHGAKLGRAPAILERVSMLDGNTPASFYSGNNIRNIKPHSGTWTVKIPKNMEYWYPKQYPANSFITDVALVLLLACTPETNPSKFDAFWR